MTSPTSGASPTSRAYGEGWGLYSEYLGLEAGFYTDPYSNFGRLTYEMWRACRLVVDTGVHALGWSRQQMIDYMAENTALSLHEVTTETDRYITWPGQALAYKLGEIEIRKLRKKAEEALGENFDVRDFHDAHSAARLCAAADPERVDRRLHRAGQLILPLAVTDTATDDGWWVYIVETASGKLYTGITTDLDRRLEEHRSGKKGARFFRLSPASEMVYRERAPDRSAATRRELEIKRMRRSKKLR